MAVREICRKVTAAGNRVIISIPHEIIGIQPTHPVQREQQVTEVAVPRAVACVAVEGNAEGAIRRIVATASVQTEYASRIIDAARGHGKWRDAQRPGASKVECKGRVRTACVDEAVAGQQVHAYLHRVGVDLRQRDSADTGRLRPFADAERVDRPRHGRRCREANRRGKRHGNKRLHFLRHFHKALLCAHGTLVLYPPRRVYCLDFVLFQAALRFPRRATKPIGPFGLKRERYGCRSISAAVFSNQQTTPETMWHSHN